MAPIFVFTQLYGIGILYNMYSYDIYSWSSSETHQDPPVIWGFEMGRLCLSTLLLCEKTAVGTGPPGPPGHRGALRRFTNVKTWSLSECHPLRLQLVSAMSWHLGVASYGRNRGNTQSFRSGFQCGVYVPDITRLALKVTFVCPDHNRKTMPDIFAFPCKKGVLWWELYALALNVLRHSRSLWGSTFII